MLISELSIEEHPFEPYVPEGAILLIIGSFPGVAGGVSDSNQEKWFYSAAGNQFWPLLSEVYNTNLKTVQGRKNLCNDQGIAITDIFKKVIRKNGSAADSNLIIKEYNDIAIRNILASGGIKKVFFTSKFVGKHFLMKFPDLQNTFYLPSPSNAANRFISTTPDYRDYKQKVLEGNIHTYRVKKYSELLKGETTGK